MARPTHDQIRSFVLGLLSHQQGEGVAKAVSDQFEISRQAASVHLQQMVSSGEIQATGVGRARAYQLAFQTLPEIEVTLEGAQEDQVWTQKVKPHLRDIPGPAQDILFYGFTEILNNAIDHSEGTKAKIVIRIDAAHVTVSVGDDGIGVFRKIARECNLADPREGVLELAKGKLTTDRTRHSGEGIFFTSRACDRFVLADNLTALVVAQGKDWVLENETDRAAGTLATLVVRRDTTTKIAEVFARYTSGDADDFAFSRTHVPVRLASFGGEQLQSRSQAKRVLNRFERFSEVLLDFEGVESIGQGFADEMFRVWPSSHPKVRLIPVQMNTAIRRMIARTLANAADAQPPELSPAIASPPEQPGAASGAPPVKTRKAPAARR